MFELNVFEKFRLLEEKLYFDICIMFMSYLLFGDGGVGGGGGGGGGGMGGGVIVVVVLVMLVMSLFGSLVWFVLCFICF